VEKKGEGTGGKKGKDASEREMYENKNVVMMEVGKRTP